MIEIERIMAQLETEYIGREIHYFEKIPSTNTVAKQQARKGAKEGTTIIAEAQIKGKGRLGRKWVSPKGGVWLSVILRPKIEAEDALKITLTTAVAVAKTLRKMFALKAEIKWPNDVLIGGKKVCGVLTEAALKEKSVNFVVVGIGVNANFGAKALPEELQATATTLRECLKKNVEIEKFVCVLLKEFEDCHKMFEEKMFDRLLDEWRSLAGFLGKRVEITGFEEDFQGVALDVDENGALIVELADGSRRRVLYGDVTVRTV